MEKSVGNEMEMGVIAVVSNRLSHMTLVNILDPVLGVFWLLAFGWGFSAA